MKRTEIILHLKNCTMPRCSFIWFSMLQLQVSKANDAFFSRLLFFSLQHVAVFPPSALQVLSFGIAAEIILLEDSEATLRTQAGHVECGGLSHVNYVNWIGKIIYKKNQSYLMTCFHVNITTKPSYHAMHQTQTYIYIYTCVCVRCKDTHISL